jgi:sensor histidine kinase YesM
VFGTTAIAMSTDVLTFSIAKLLGIPPEIPQMNVQNVILMFFFVQIIKSIVKKNKFISLPIKITHYVALILIPLGSMVLGYFVLVPSINAATAVTAGFLLVINLFVFWLLNEITEILAKNYQNEILQSRAESYKKELETLKQSEKRIGFLRHDMKNHLLAIRHFYENKEFDKIPEYIDTAVLYISPQTAFSSSGNTDIDSILNYKLGLAADLGIKIKTDITIPEELSIGAFELSVILGNLIDNAVTAAQNAKEKLLEVSITYIKNTLLIAISNTFNTADFNDFATTKSNKKNHGLGLQSVRDIVDRNDGIFGVEKIGDLVIAKVAFMLK